MGMKMHSILLVEDRAGLREAYLSFLRKNAFMVTAVASAEEAERLLNEREFDILLLDYMLPGMNGMEFLQRVKSQEKELIVILMTAFGEVKLAVKAMQSGAFDFLEKPIDLEYLLIVLERAKSIHSQGQRVALQEHVESRKDRSIIGDSAVMKEVLGLVDQVAVSHATCLVLGESGTGKELFARRIHDKSKRMQGPFLAVNCSALPRDLIESELFGYEKGAFTGAHGRKPGLIELADGGTLFLDEIGDMPTDLQPKLLRFIQEGEFRRVGGQKVVKADVRLVCATNRNLAVALREGSFREDLYFRISVFPIELPPLRDRIEDIPLLAQHFVNKAGPASEIPAPVIRLLRSYSWPGNVRELQNIMERAAILSRGRNLKPTDFPTNLTDERVAAAFHIDLSVTYKENFARLSSEMERQMIQLLMRELNGKKSAVAARLGLSSKTLTHKLKIYGITD